MRATRETEGTSGDIAEPAGIPELVLSTAQASEHLALQQFYLCCFSSSEIWKCLCNLTAFHPALQIRPNVCTHHLMTDLKWNEISFD